MIDWRRWLTIAIVVAMVSTQLWFTVKYLRGERWGGVDTGEDDYRVRGPRG